MFAPTVQPEERNMKFSDIKTGRILKNVQLISAQTSL